MKGIIFWDMTPCNPWSCARRFGGTYRLHFQGRRNRFSKPASKQVASRIKLFQASILSTSILFCCIFSWKLKNPLFWYYKCQEMAEEVLFPLMISRTEYTQRSRTSLKTIYLALIMRSDFHWTHPFRCHGIIVSTMQLAFQPDPLVPPSELHTWHDESELQEAHIN
jgi:hypothetical protein